MSGEDKEKYMEWVMSGKQGPRPVRPVPPVSPGMQRSVFWRKLLPRAAALGLGGGIGTGLGYLVTEAMDATPVNLGEGPGMHPNAMTDLVPEDMPKDGNTGAIGTDPKVQDGVELLEEGLPPVLEEIKTMEDLKNAARGSKMKKSLDKVKSTSGERTLEDLKREIEKRVDKRLEDRNNMRKGQ